MMEYIKLFWEDAPEGEPSVILYEVDTENEWLVLRSIDIYAVEKDGPRLLSWHRNWDMPYMITGFRSAH